MDRNEALEEVRKRMAAKKGGRVRDPFQFNAPQAKPGEELKYKFYVLPGLNEGETCANGVASRNMELWYNPVGTHWINQRPYECPRAHDGVDCPFCQLGFDLLKDTDDDETRRSIIKTYLARNSFAVNIYFPPFESTPPDLRGKVMWYSMPKTIFDVMEATIMKNTAGDDTDPQAYGLFYDPMDAYVFQLDIRKQGEFNDYKQSKFLPSTKGAMIKNKDGEAVEAAIAKVLAMRHDLFTKFAARDAALLRQRADEILKPEPDRKSAQVVEDKMVEETVAETIAEPETAPVAKPVTQAKPTTQATAKPATQAKPTTQATAKPAAKATPVVSEPDDEELTRLLNDIRTGK